MNMTLHKLTAISFIFIILMGSCKTKQVPLSENYNSYEGTIYFLNGETKSGLVLMPRADSKTVRFAAQRSKDAKEITFQAEQIDRIEFDVDGQSGKVNVVRYLPIKMVLGITSTRWVMLVAEGEYASAYIGASNYSINYDGSITLTGTRQIINHGNGMAIIQPSFPVFMQKEGAEMLTQVALKEGVSFEGSAFRSGVSRYLSNDPKLCEHMRSEKWGFDKISTLVKNYNPNRGSDDLTLDGVVIVPKKKSLITSDLDNEMLFNVEVAMPSDKYYGTQFGIGLRSSAAKFLSYGADLGYASAKYVDQEKRVQNHLINDLYTAPVIDEDFSDSGLFRFNTFIGAQLPLNLKKVYLVPAAHISFGGMAGGDYATLHYGPMVTFDLGFKLKDGNILMIGTGYRRNISLKGEEDKEEASAPGFEAYQPYNNLLIRLSYKF